MVSIEKNETITIEPMHWSDALSIGYPLIDKHHKKLFSITEKLHKLIYAPCTDKRQQKIANIAVALRNYAIYHFSAEENILKKNKCELYFEHKQEHDIFIQTVERLFPELIRGDLPAQKEVYEFLVNWLVHHICESDKRWADRIHLQKKNDPPS